MMKLSLSICITLSSSLFSTVASAGEQQYFETYNVTTEADDFGLCLKDVPGCLSISSTTRSCKAPAVIGPLEGIGSDESQQWTYKNGLLKNQKSVGYSYWYSKNVYGCLGLPRGTYELKEGNEYPLIRRSCPCNDQDAPQYMQFVLNNGLIQSLAPVVVSNINKRALQEDDEDETDKTTTPIPFCVTINEAADNGAASVEGALVTLKQCDYNQDENNPAQSFIPFGYRQPFLQSTQDVWGKKDIIQFAFDFGSDYDNNEEDKDDKKIIIDLYTYDTLEDNPVYTIEHELQEGEEDVSSSTSSGIITLDVSNAGLASGKYKATFHGYDDDDIMYATHFIVSPSEEHVTYANGGYTNTKDNEEDTSNLLPAVGFIVVMFGPLICLLCVVWCNRKKNRATTFSPGSPHQHVDDDDDDATVLTMDEEKGNNNNDDDDDDTTTDTHSQSSASQD